ncbi:hypothetical protein HAX54_013856 [Datura stramonium]|uniref:Uncharacterized protein n=1 Tax=Datura stramonium TaxID=4076 RepID=A0ABS8TN02_DATST|nr:hypothetical protein [Datura stramonium]
MWRRSASFILDNNQNDIVAKTESHNLSPPSAAAQAAVGHQSEDAVSVNRSSKSGDLVSEATTMMELEIELKKASDSLKNVPSSFKFGTLSCSIGGSGEEVEVKYEKAYSVKPKSANFIDQLTMNPGVLIHRGSNRGKWTAAINSDTEGLWAGGGEDILAISGSSDDDYGSDEESGSSTLYSN